MGMLHGTQGTWTWASCRWICSRRAAWRKLRAAAARAVRTARRRGHGFTSIGLSRLTVGAPSCGTWHTSSCRNQHRRAATSIAVEEHARVKLPRRVEVDLLLPLPAAYKAAQLLSMRPALLLWIESPAASANMQRVSLQRVMASQGVHAGRLRRHAKAGRASGLCCVAAAIGGRTCFCHPQLEAFLGVDDFW